MGAGPNYADSGWWQGLVALLALALSQLPPVRLWFKRPKLDLVAFEKIVLTEDVGLPGVQLHINITNSGGREVRINKIALLLKRQDDPTRELIGRGYFEKASDPQAVLLTPFQLKPKEEWGHVVNFFNYRTREDQKAYAAAVSDLKRNIINKRANLPKDHPDVEADADIVLRLQQMFDASFYWRSGEYSVELLVETDAAKANVKNTYRITLFESDSEALYSHRNELKTGHGVMVRGPQVEPLLVDLRRDH
ncbi:hypothetical protein [Ralstonia pseudosolanacearum]|uniref:hypothetical protein n=1 Tax=Ralstonia pseudosolanacearum TaxID=1310165 RepID=UPI002675BB7E|nr:hypothetical protein [Ralstonia pseudosolanacearum]MDO3562713.1 hypothetical protein [Ralstonia pseudosolanacearum]MDO3572380.1 hypothetical protein [Ralstonia pseudosolanacearum]